MGNAADGDANELIDSVLAEVADLSRHVQVKSARAKMEALLRGLPGTTLASFEGRIRQGISESFFRKNRDALIDLLNQRLTGFVPAPDTDTLAEASEEPGAAGAEEVVSALPVTLHDVHPRAKPLTVMPTVPPLNAAEVDERFAEFENVLQVLSERHIYQWSTFYRDWLTDDFDWLLTAMERYRRPSELLERVRLAMAAHSREIFQKGYRYVTTQEDGHEYAVTKSLNGLKRFLDLAVEFYSSKLPAAAAIEQSRRLRALTSSMLVGVLHGYAQVSFGWEAGEDILARFATYWAHTLAFLQPYDIESLLERLPRNEFTDAVGVYFTPLAEAIEQIGKQRTHMPLPTASQLRWGSGRLNIWLRPSTLSPFPQLIELECYLDAKYLQDNDLVEAAGRGVAVVVAPLRSDLHAAKQPESRLPGIVVTSDGDAAKIPEIREKIRNILAIRAYRQDTAWTRRQPLTQNPARAFPLNNPDLLRHFLVYRQTVRDLLRDFESRSGVRLWCSVRRSGKTTAGSRLDTSTGTVAVIKQTCDSTGENTNDSFLYDQVVDALSRGQQIPADFLSSIVEQCGDGQDSQDRFVLVLDEYETLFGRLKAAAGRNRELRYAVAQPLLNQMVRFARDNLLIFLGQQPNAHYIFMDQNQLSPYVQHDAFPLFGHDSGDSMEEFAQLVHLILTKVMDPDTSFIDAIFKETAGHPFLTVNLLADFVDWLIEKRRLVADLNLGAEDVARYAGERLTAKQVRMSRDYTFFREAVGQAMGDAGQEETPWLHAVYSSLSALVHASPESLRCSRDDFREIATRVQGEHGIDADQLLLSASNSNFLAYDDQYVWPRIRLLGRISSVSQGALST